MNDITKHLLDKANKCISEGSILCKSKKQKDKDRGNHLISLGQLVNEIYHEADEKEFEERAKALFLSEIKC